MNKIVIKRTTFRPDRTLGKLYIDGVEICDTLEPTDRAMEWDKQKVKGKTAIPLGTYSFRLWDSPRFKCTTLRLIDVPNFSDILVHTGNYPSDTQGCILVGTAIESGILVHSKKALDEVVELATSKRIKFITITR